MAPAPAATQDQQQNSDPDLRRLQPQPTAVAAPAATRPLSAYNRTDAAEIAAAAPGGAPRAAAVAPAPFAPPAFALPSSAKVALEELRVSLDPRLVTHSTGHALLPALSAAGIRARVGSGGGGSAGGGGGSGGKQQTHSLRWRTVLFFRRRRRGGAAPRRRAAPRRAADADADAAVDEEDDEDETGDFEEEQVPFALACLTAADVVRAVDAARSVEEEGGSSSPDFDPGAGLERLVRDAALRFPGCTLGVAVEGLEAHCISRERADAARGARPGGGPSTPGGKRQQQQQQGCFVARRYDPRLLAASAALRFPALRLALLPDAAAVAEHVVGLARALAEQPLRAAAAASSVPRSASSSSSSASRQQLLRTHGGGRRGDTQAAREALLLLEAPAGGNGQQLPAASVALARALARVPGVGPAAAIAVAAEHGSFGALMRFVEEAGVGAGAGAAGRGGGAAAAGAASVLAELRTRARGSAAASGPRVGPAAARRIVAMLRAVDGGAAADW